MDGLVGEVTDAWMKGMRWDWDRLIAIKKRELDRGRDEVRKFEWIRWAL